MDEATTIETVGAAAVHQEYWIPTERLDEFNQNIVGKIEVISRFDTIEW